MVDENYYAKSSGNHDEVSGHSVCHGYHVAGPDESSGSAMHPLLESLPIADMLSRFNREKIPERAVHARGTGAYGEFEVTHDISDICGIDMLLGVGKKTSCVARFSTTTLERGSAESTRDPKGMAIKFFTEQGEWDWLCLNIPMFFIRDPAKFPDLMRAQRRDPKNNLMNANTWWEWVCRNHESLHMVLWLYSDFGTMFNYRTLSGYVGHAYKWVKPDGNWKYVHFFLSSDCGPNFAEGDSGNNAPPTDQDSATRDLYEAIERGEYPTWTANVQVVDPKDAYKLAFNILDLTKHWNLGNYPSDVDVIPARPFGKLTLTRNPQNYMDEIERQAFSPSNLVPGVEPSEDPVLLSRMFAYPDAQSYRLGLKSQCLPPKRLASTIDHLLHKGSPAITHNVNTHQRETLDCRSTAANEPRTHDEKFDSWVATVSSKAWSQANELDYKYPRELWKVLPVLRSPEFQHRIVVNMAQSVAEARSNIRNEVYRTLALVATDLSEQVQDAAEKLVRQTVSSRGNPGPSKLRSCECMTVCLFF
ncbi:putative catalase Cat [Xylaria cubensis]|nr:putative catalase Cat [Xylaria cubensis]